MTTSVIKSRITATLTGQPGDPQTSRVYKRNQVVYPQWMRTLEEKYKRLHMKIRKSTSSMTYMYNSSLGRNITEQKTARQGVFSSRNEAPTKPLSDSQQITVLQNTSNTQVKSTPCSSATKIRIAATEISDGPEIVKEVCDNVIINENTCSCEREWETKSLDSNGNINNACVRECDCQSQRDLEVPCDNTAGSTDNNMNKRHIEKAGLKTKCKKVNIAPIEQVGNKTSIETSDCNNVIGVESSSPFITHIGPRKNSPRTKTSVSRRSTVTQKTSKSCPPAMELDIATFNHVSHKAVPTLRAKSAYSGKPLTFRSSKLFSRMSQEAQHAMNETMKDREGLKTPNNDVKTQQWIDENFTHQDIILTRVQENVPIKQYHNPENKGRGYYLDEDVYETNFNMDDILPDDSCTDSEMSVTTRRRPITAATNKTRLPSIPSDSTADFCTLGQLNHYNLRLPGIGRYEIATLREKTFEITPPGYDIRYNDIAVFEDGERVSELPSDDIRERAVQKCQDWLSRHSPRKELS
ncbi:uncharacterized protein LOC133189009 [Saccostrea echinata]|uniref:uncharacterized protein LOC133189009 n=1 Tax=Saccostrea echinata TaxID=191078 RepID=UPI002A81F5B0|nr:uncharacterized protein LOC133189009 [Saccostrea echinata]